MYLKVGVERFDILLCVWELPNAESVPGSAVNGRFVLEFSRFLQANVNPLKPNGHVMHHQFNIQQLYALPTLYLCVLHLSENKQRLVPLTA